MWCYGESELSNRAVIDAGSDVKIENVEERKGRMHELLRVDASKIFGFIDNYGQGRAGHWKRQLFPDQCLSVDNKPQIQKRRAA